MDGAPLNDGSDGTPPSWVEPRASADDAAERSFMGGGHRFVAVAQGEHGVLRAAESQRRRDDGPQYGTDIGRRLRDHAQDIGGRGLLLQGLARLGDQPRILHGDHGLRRESLQKRDLPIGERPHLHADANDLSEQPAVRAQGNAEQGLHAALGGGPGHRLVDQANIGKLGERRAVDQLPDVGPGA